MTESCPVGFEPRGVIRQYVKDPDLTWQRIFCELLDNSLDADSRYIKIIKGDGMVIIKDDGVGCPKPEKFVSFGGSHAHSLERSGYFGLGGTISGIRASQGTLVEYITTIDGQTHKIVAYWAKMMDGEPAICPLESRRAAPGEKGTTIRIHNPMKFKDTEKIARDLGFYYGDAIRSGLTICFSVDGKEYPVVAYRHPPFDREVKFRFDFDGHSVIGYCGVVRKGKPNPYKGWVIHWGPHRRVLDVRIEPSGGRSIQLIHGHVYLPTEYRNLNVTKDSFAEIPERLYELIAEHCEEIIAAGDELATDFELESFTESLEIGLNGMLRPKVKGRRPASAGKEGTVEPSGNGRSHKEFGPHQPGDKGVPREPTGADSKTAHYPFKIEWPPDMEQPWMIQISQSRRYPSRVFLDQKNPAFAGFLERKDPIGLNVVILALIATHLGRNQDQQRWLGVYETMVAEEFFERHTLPAGQKVGVA